METQRLVCVCFDGFPVIFNIHTILFTKSISSLSNLKSKNYRKSDIRIRKKEKKYDDNGDDDDRDGDGDRL